jgi:hypothetical protein
MNNHPLNKDIPSRVPSEGAKKCDIYEQSFGRLEIFDSQRVEKN